MPPITKQKQNFAYVAETENSESQSYHTQSFMTKATRYGVEIISVWGMRWFSSKTQIFKNLFEPQISTYQEPTITNEQLQRSTER